MKRVKKLHVKEKVNTLRLKAGIKAREAKQWASENKELVIGIATVTIPAAAGFGGKLISRNKVAKEEKRRARDYYDPRTGRHWVCKRTPSVKEQIRIENRYEHGESYGSILKDLKLI
jgi:hypothetical protein